MKPLIKKGKNRYELPLRDGKPGKRCHVDGCGNKAPKGRAGNICSACLMRKWRANNPERASWNWLLSSAQKRDVPVQITFEEFCAFGKKHRYFDRKGPGRAAPRGTRVLTAWIRV